jgi:hypothetical protein
MSYFAWAKAGKSWKLVATGASEQEAYRELRRWIDKQPRPPVASAVLPVGVRPERKVEDDPAD